MDYPQHVLHTVQHANPAIVVADTTAVTIAAASWMGYIPSVAAVLSIIWLVIQIASSIDTWLERRHYFKGPKGDKGEKGDSWHDSM